MWYFDWKCNIPNGLAYLQNAHLLQAWKPLQNDNRIGLFLKHFNMSDLILLYKFFEYMLRSILDFISLHVFWNSDISEQMTDMIMNNVVMYFMMKNDNHAITEMYTYYNEQKNIQTRLQRYVELDWRSF